jgi:uncharacterized membrane protein
MVEIKEDKIIINEKAFELEQNIIELDDKFCVNYAFIQGSLIMVEGQIKVIDEIITRKIEQQMSDDKMIDLDLTNTIYLAIESMFADICDRNVKLFTDLLEITDKDIKTIEDSGIDIYPDIEKKMLSFKKRSES